MRKDDRRGPKRAIRLAYRLGPPPPLPPSPLPWPTRAGTAEFTELADGFLRLLADLQAANRQDLLPAPHWPAAFKLSVMAAAHAIERKHVHSENWPRDTIKSLLRKVPAPIWRKRSNIRKLRFLPVMDSEILAVIRRIKRRSGLAIESTANVAISLALRIRSDLPRGPRQGRPEPPQNPTPVSTYVRDCLRLGAAYQKAVDGKRLTRDDVLALVEHAPPGFEWTPRGKQTVPEWEEQNAPRIAAALKEPHDQMVRLFSENELLIQNLIAWVTEIGSPAAKREIALIDFVMNKGRHPTRQHLKELRRHQAALRQRQSRRRRSKIS